MTPEERFEQRMLTDSGTWYKEQRYRAWRWEMQKQQLKKQNFEFRYTLATKLIKEGRWE